MDNYQSSEMSICSGDAEEDSSDSGLDAPASIHTDIDINLDLDNALMYQEDIEFGMIQSHDTWTRASINIIMDNTTLPECKSSLLP